MYMNDIIGHKDIRELFDTLIKKDALHHAYCLVGNEYVGKRTLAEILAASLLHIKTETIHTHPDVYIVKQEKNKKTGKTKKNIDIEQIRTMRHVTSQYAAMKGYTVVIIDGAEKMSIGASNALLKTLEEPTGKTIFFLLTHDESRLLATIRSRCHMIYLHPVLDKEIEGALEERGYEESLSHDIARLSRGCPGRAIQWAKDPDEFDAYKQEVRRFLSLINTPLYKKIALTDDLFGDKTDHIQTRETLIRVLDIWLLIIRDMAMISQGGKPSMQIHKLPESIALPKKQLLTIEKRIYKTKEQLRRNIHPRLSVEHILLAF